MYRIVFLICSSILLNACKPDKKKITVLPYYNEPTFTPIFLKNSVKDSPKLFHKVGNFTLLNQDNIIVSQNIVKGKIHVANFIFTSCGNICPTMTKNLKVVSDYFTHKNQLVILSFSVTPWIDKPYVLKQFKKLNGIKNKDWHFLTGSKNEIYKLARRSYFAEEDLGFSKDSTEFLHTEHVILVDRNKHIRGIYNGTLILEMQQLIADIKILNSEK